MKFKSLLLLMLFPMLAWGQLGKFVNPGPLSNPHAKLEGLKNCTQCHSASQGLPNAKCLDCHTDIEQRLQTRKGYHARKLGECVSCHSEHKGRDYDVTGLSRINFNHVDTGWPLTGKHRKAQCTDCHTTKRKDSNSTTYLEADSECASCHVKDSPHKSKKKKFQACQNCHGTSDWKTRDRMHFDHNTETRFPLTGNHAKIDCASCHTKKVWAPLAFAQCSDCHADPHAGSFGPKCSDCHTSTTAWATSSKVSMSIGGGGDTKGFDHDKTQFPLQGKHQSVSCKSCHGTKIGKMPKTDFRDCKGCHVSPHKSQFQKLWSPKTCESCHSTYGFANLNKFKHNEDSRYELLGQHKTVSCASCHAGGKYRWLSQTPDCDECHADVHKGQYKPQKCSSCHSFDGFKQKEFDHSQTRFPLAGKHKAVACNDCHSSGQFKSMDTACKSCHVDNHQGQLAGECETCHSPTGFKDVDFDHNRQARFRLDGKHKENTCNQCHWGGKYKFEQVRCASCHFDVHNGAHGNECDRCHTTSGFKMEEGFHEFGEYQLGGIHNQMECNQCHSPKAPIRIDSMQCSSCHQDPHMNSLSNRCYECHNQVSWRPTTFRHSQTSFDLTGAHRFLDCSSCHSNRVFGGLPSECQFCHFKDFDVSLPQHASGSTSCDSCHFTFGFRPAKP